MITEITFTDGLPNWPDDVDTFLHPGSLVDDKLIIEYTGALSLPVYGGDWPILTYSKDITSEELIHLFTFDEWEEVESLTQVAAQRFLSLLSKRKDRFSIENLKVVQFLDAVAANTSITASRIQEIKKGIEI